MATFNIKFDEKAATRIIGSSITDIYVDSSQKVIVVGTFHEVNNTPVNCITRLNPDGSVDNSFYSPDENNYNINRVIPSVSGNGYFISGNLSYEGIKKLTYEGNIMPGFSLSLKNGAVIDIATMQGDEYNYIIAVGTFKEANGIPCDGVIIAREDTGEIIYNLSSLLTIPANTFVSVESVSVVSNKIYIAGRFHGNDYPHILGCFTISEVTPTYENYVPLFSSQLQDTQAGFGLVNILAHSNGYVYAIGTALKTGVSAYYRALGFKAIDTTDFEVVELDYNNSPVYGVQTRKMKEAEDGYIYFAGAYEVPGVSGDEKYEAICTKLQGTGSYLHIADLITVAKGVRNNTAPVCNVALKNEFTGNLLVGLVRQEANDNLYKILTI